MIHQRVKVRKGILAFTVKTQMKVLTFYRTSNQHLRFKSLVDLHKRKAQKQKEVVELIGSISKVVISGSNISNLRWILKLKTFHLSKE